MSNVVDHAEQFARSAHAGQVDKRGRNYADGHLAEVAALLRPLGPEAEAAGWLHDVLEDTPTDCTALADADFPDAVIHAVWACTRQPGEPYTDLIDRAAADPLGRWVKLMDNWVNLTGLDELTKVDPEKATSLRKRYEPARVTLLACCGMPPPA